MGYRQPYADPARVLRINGNKCKLKLADGTEIEDIHMEDVIKVPERSRNLEKKDDIRWEQGMDDDGVDLDGEEIDRADIRRSPGEMLEDAGAKVRAKEQKLKEAGKVSRGKGAR